jgi:hypothetical protein
MEVPFGDLFYEDLTYLPGVLTFNFFGHEIQVMPRILTINQKEHPWTTSLKLNLIPESKTLKSSRGLERKSEAAH